jgi:hypothetical protein
MIIINHNMTHIEIIKLKIFLVYKIQNHTNLKKVLIIKLHLNAYYYRSITLLSI